MDAVTMSTSILLVWLVTIPITLIHATLQPQGYLINCGSSENVEEGPLKYTPDDGYISTGNKTTLNRKDILPVLQTLRFFPDTKSRKYCYTIPVIKGGKYLVKTVFFYGGFDGGKTPPVFDQIIDGTRWSIVNTTDDYANGGTSYYEAIVMAQNKFLSVCLARNRHTGPDSSPFISALEVYDIEDSVYNATNWENDMLVTVARNTFGSNGKMISFPDDTYNRYWHSFMDNNPTSSSNASVNSSSFWNLPPHNAFASALTNSRGKTLTLNWPPFDLASGRYYITLYFRDNRTPSPYSWRVFDIQVNKENFFKKLNVTSGGVSVFGTDWPLNGKTEISLIPANDTPVGPMINAGEIFQIIPIGGKTVTRDAVAMDDFRRELSDPPEDWTGDPCLPVENSWTGVLCSLKSPLRIISVNLTGLGLSGSLPESITKLTAVKELLLADNKLTGPIPDLSALKSLEKLHLENNQLEGPLPQTLGDLPNLQEMFLQNNKFNGSTPDSLIKKNGTTVQL